MSSYELLDHWRKISPLFESELQNFFSRPLKYKGELWLQKSMCYSLFSGGKRFRPMLSLASSLSLEQEFNPSLPWAMAIECVHTYSLIHDDLPCMDDDDERRSRPTNHKVFGEAGALLAGDGLLTEAFGIIALKYKDHKNLGSLVQLLWESSGLEGMVKGQANDLWTQEKTLEVLIDIHKNKTAALIQAACTGPFYIFDQLEEIESIKKMGENLGLLFQIKDDELDQDSGESLNIYTLMGNTQTLNFYRDLYKETQSLLETLERKHHMKWFRQLMEYNENRQI